MLVNDVQADADVNRDRHVPPHAGRQHALLAIGKLLALDHSPDGLAQPDAVALGLAGGVVDPAGFGPEAELPLGHVSGDALGGRADQCQLEVVDCPRPVQGQMRQQPALDQIGQQRRAPFLSTCART